MSSFSARSCIRLLVVLTSSIGGKALTCRYNTTSPHTIAYYTCSQLASKYSISVDKFVLLNPGINAACTNLQPDTKYCVDGLITPITLTGDCGPSSPNTTCKGYSGGGCCNSRTWLCQNSTDACAPGACYEGYCEGNNPSDYSLNGKCGGVTGFKICTGLFGSCCNMDGRCGDGLGFCDTANCSYGNCTIAANATISAPSPTATLPPSSSDGKCGGPNGTMCNNVFGYCCGGDGVCGDGLAACGSGCQRKFGKCNSDETQGDVSGDGSCGGDAGFSCIGSTYGDCCSSVGHCGNSSAYCNGGCQPGFGRCEGSNISSDGTCGGINGYVCKGSQWGDCCSSSGFCGNGTSFCGGGCNSAFGTCGTTKTTPDGSCGGSHGYDCLGSSQGNCCSHSGFCGNTTDFCGAGCQSSFGTCTNSNLSPDGTCGGSAGHNCIGFAKGNCCSGSGFCGGDATYCGTGCQSKFGNCSNTPTSTRTASTSPTPSNVSQDGSCGSNGRTCVGTLFGGCCSSENYCGTTIKHCAQGCQTKYSNNCQKAPITSLNGNCGTKNGGFTCAGSGGPFDGQCCSSSGYCGKESSFCGTGCQKGYGKCN